MEFEFDLEGFGLHDNVDLEPFPGLGVPLDGTTSQEYFREPSLSHTIVLHAPPNDTALMTSSGLENAHLTRTTHLATIDPSQYFSSYYPPASGQSQVPVAELQPGSYRRFAGTGEQGAL
jgi:hypothetical protein